MPTATQVKQFIQQAGQPTGWHQLVDDVNTWLAATAAEIKDVWVEQSVSQRNGIDAVSIYILYQETQEARSLSYTAAYNNGDPTEDFADWFADEITTNAATQVPLFVINVPALGRGDTEKFNQFFYIYLDLTAHPDQIDTATSTLIADPVAPIAALGQGTANLYNSQGVLIGQRLVRNLDGNNAWPVGDRNYVVVETEVDIAAGNAYYKGVPSGCP